MTDEFFTSQIVEITQTLYRVSYAQLAQSHDREDAVQECLRKAWEKRRMLKDDRYFQTWIIRILINECHNIQRKKQRFVLMEEMPRGEAQDLATEDGMLRAALFRLEEKLRLPILLHYIEGYQLNEISKILRIPQGTVKSRMARGRKQLRSFLSEEVFEG